MIKSTRKEQHQGITRRGFLAGTAVAAIQLSVFGLAGCAPSEQGGSAGVRAFVPGAYSAAVMGKKDDVVVEVTFDETSIVSIEVVQSNETPRICTMAEESLPQRIVEYQNLDIDTITGATLTSMAVIGAVRNCVEQAGGSASALENKPLPPKSTEVVEKDADIVVIGGGGAGTTAAVYAAEKGARVVLLEKTSSIGGNLLVSGGAIDCLNMPDEYRDEMNDGYAALFQSTLEAARQKGASEEYIAQVQKDYDTYYANGGTKAYESNEYYALDYFVRNGNDIQGHGLPMATNVTNFVSWLTDNLDFKWVKPLYGIAGFPWPRKSRPLDSFEGQGFYDYFEAAIERMSLPIDILTLTTATKLITEDNAVTGVVGVCDDGTTYNIHASKGVILASGGFSGNQDMMKKYNEMWPWDESTEVHTTNTYGHTGDGILLAQEVAAGLADMGRMMLFPYADTQDYSLSTLVGNSNCMAINKTGERFVDETLDRFSLSRAVMGQPDNVCILISDALNSAINEDGLNDFGQDTEILIKQKRLYKADTLAELAGMIGVDQNVLQATVEKYNAMVDSGSDPEFGRTKFNDNCYIKTPPFYASPRTWAAHVTIGGVAIDEGFRVLDEDASVIPGLFAIGECAAGQSGVSSMSNAVGCINALIAS